LEETWDKKSPAQGGPTRGSSALGLGGKNERAEQNKHGGRGFVPPLNLFFRELAVIREAAPRRPIVARKSGKSPDLAGLPHHARDLKRCE
jgi:hypothetical protein